MITVICGIAGLMGLYDLFSKPADRTLPWWGDVIVLVSSALIYIIVSRIVPDDE